MQCLYCYMVCPQEAIGIRGSLGYHEVHMSKYKKMAETL
ncbi:MAG: hypothetical protein HYU86_03700 [Chloroflexi bacterium]|nr:hypothetical protein [Chloroflexota bacterium]